MKQIFLIFITLGFGLTGIHRLIAGDRIVAFIFLILLLIGFASSNLGFELANLFFGVLLVLWLVDVYSTLFRKKLIKYPFLSKADGTNDAATKIENKSEQPNRFSKEDERELEQLRSSEDKQKNSNKNVQKITKPTFTGKEDPSKFISSILEVIIDQNLDSFKDEDTFLVRPGYSYDKFYLDRVDGSYDMSLQGLIHHIMFDTGVYKSILTSSEFKDCERIVSKQPESIYSPGYETEEEEETQDKLGAIYHNCIKFVGDKLIKEGFNVDGFEDYLD